MQKAFFLLFPSRTPFHPLLPPTLRQIERPRPLLTPPQAKKASLILYIPYHFYNILPIYTHFLSIKSRLLRQNTAQPLNQSPPTPPRPRTLLTAVAIFIPHLPLPTAGALQRVNVEVGDEFRTGDTRDIVVEGTVGGAWLLAL